MHSCAPYSLGWGAAACILSLQEATVHAQTICRLAVVQRVRTMRPLLRPLAKTVCASMLPSRRAKGLATAGTVRDITLGAAKLATPVLNLASKAQCTGDGCAFLAAVECLPPGGDLCTPDYGNNIGTGNVGGENFGEKLAPGFQL